MKDFLKKENQLCSELFSKTKKDLYKLSKKLNIENVSIDFLRYTVIPLASFFGSFKKRRRPYFICLTGGQGSGKTTLSEFVQLILQKGCDREVVGFSIDDIYKTKEERIHLSNTVHPLCKTRGVPGTHDVQLGLDTLDSLFNANFSSLTPIPSFSKPLDKHIPKEDWSCYKGRPEFIFFDAWCGGARPISEENWRPPMNILEEEEDPEGIWSKWSNKELSGTYQELFNRFDLLLMIKVPSIKQVYESRWLQEQTLAKSTFDPKLKKKIMTKEEVWRFVMHYERLTRYMLEEMPTFADIVLKRDKNFNFSFIKIP